MFLVRKRGVWEGGDTLVVVPEKEMEGAVLAAVAALAGTRWVDIQAVFLGQGDIQGLDTT